ncbi:hypothetical protein JMJ35_001645 [Cladonia borealis]|uniref:Uncharacterized protein n=1 Tax=Cladonia borealis TaxID=184061 RepID=A0AA39R7N8_9LECA|nr:hypothetical protein JMJ35_001645 [Cladonia borealis]
MVRQKSSSAASGHLDNRSAYEMVSYEELKEQKRTPSKGIMGGWILEIGFASGVLILPMFTLTAVLLALVYGHNMPYHSSTYSYNNETELPLGAAYFVNYPATTLVYIASLSSTLATLLISAAMILFSYSLARSMTLESDANNAPKLPSPFQLQLLIRMVDGRLTALGSYLLYRLGKKQRQVTVVPMLIEAVAMMLALVLLAGLITLADLWLHLSTKSVQYLELRPQAAPDWFNPGRGVNQSCLDDPMFDAVNNVTGCLIPVDVGSLPVLINESEYFKTAGNISDLNKVYLGFHEGLQYSVLGPAHIPDDLDFQATSYGSHTECRVVTTQCGAGSTHGDGPNVSNFACNNTVAGLNMTGNFYWLGEAIESYKGGPNNFSGINNVNTMSQSDFAFGFQYFNDSAKQEQVEQPGDEGLGSDESGTISSITNQYFWALAFSLLSFANAAQNPWARLNLVGNNEGGADGIMSCETNISEITYNMSQSAIAIISTSPPRPNASFPFINGITGSWGDEQLYQGLQLSVVGAETSEDLASSFATVYDQTLVAIPAGVLNALPVVNATQRVQTQVARVQKAPLVCLLLLNLLYAGVGIVLTATALVAVRFDGPRVGEGVIGAGGRIRDAQARLSVAAIVAESFEAPNLGEDAKSVDDLFAERRGQVTRRVALGMGQGGGRRFRQVIVREEKGDGEGTGLVSSREEEREG